MTSQENPQIQIMKVLNIQRIRRLGQTDFPAKDVLRPRRKHPAVRAARKFQHCEKFSQAAIGMRKQRCRQSGGGGAFLFKIAAARVSAAWERNLQHDKCNIAR